MTLVRRLAVIALCGALSACATVPDDAALKPASPTVGDEAPERLRARLRTQLAASYFEIGNMSVALEEIKEALRADPNYGPAYNVAGLIYAQLKEDRMAEQSFQRAISINPGDHDALNNYGQYLCQRGQERESIKYFLAAVKNPLYPFPDRSYVNAGVCSRRAGNPAGADEYFRAALKVRPNQPQALYHLADMAYGRGDLNAAKANLSLLAQAGVDTPEVLWLGLRVVRKLGDRTAEASYASQLRNKFPKSAETRMLNAGQYE